MNSYNNADVVIGCVASRQPTSSPTDLVSPSWTNEPVDLTATIDSEHKPLVCLSDSPVNKPANPGIYNVRPNGRGRIGFNTVWSVLCSQRSHKTLQTVLKHAYIDDPRATGRPSFTARLVGCSLRAPWSVVANSQTDRHRANMWAVVGRCFGVKLVKSRNYLSYFGSFNLFAVNKDILYFVE